MLFVSRTSNISMEIALGGNQLTLPPLVTICHMGQTFMPK